MSEKNGGEPVRELRISKIQVLVEVDLLQDGVKVGEGTLGAKDERTGQELPYVFYTSEALTQWAESLETMIEALAKEPV